MMKCEWILCPVCGSKTRNKIRKDTVLKNYPWSYVKKKYKLNTTNFLFLCNC
ncbi:cysteine-rich KTR domain-containing protein [Sellimonas catena]|uniref:cysteine-rich KTR domain-containing protein n=1 Tax=Sellimonas catena TaxID=2994035 RepID=UPI003868C830